MSSLITLNFKLLIQFDLLLIVCMCIHNSNICAIDLQTNNVILIFNII